MKWRILFCTAVWGFSCVFATVASAQDALAPDQYEQNDTAQTPRSLGDLKLAGDAAAPGVKLAIQANLYSETDGADYYRVTLRDESISAAI